MALVFHDGFETGGADAWQAVTGSPSFPAISTIDEETNHLVTGSDELIDEVNYCAQTFTPSSNTLVGEVEVYMFKTNAAQTADLEIAVQGVDGSNHPDGTDLYSQAYPAADISTTAGWHKFKFDQQVQLTGSTRYAIVLRSPDSTSYGYQCYSNNSSPQIPNGNLEESDNAGSSWNARTGKDMSISIRSSYSRTGNYGMRCNVSGATAYVERSGSVKQVTFYLYINSAPSGSDIRIFGGATAAVWSLYLTTTREIDLYYGSTPTKKADGTTQLDVGKWYRISISCDSSANVKVYIDGTQEHSTYETGHTNLISWLGVQTSGTADLIFDDYACDTTDSTNDLGDIRTLAARPTANGTDQNFGNNAWQQRTGGSDTTNNPVYSDLAEDPPDTDQGAWEEADNTAHYYSVDLDNCGSGNLSDINSGDTIHAVNFLFYYETDGGGTGAYYMYGRDTSGRSSTVELDDPKAPTWISQYQTTSWDDDSSSWSQTEFNDQEMGMMCQDANKDLWWYEAYAMVAFEPAATIYLTGTCGATSSVSGDIEVEKEITGTCDATSSVSGDIEVEKEITGTCDATTTVDGDLSVKIKLTGTCDATTTVDGDIEVEKLLTGTCDATTTIDGDLKVEKLLTGTCDATTTVDGDLEVEKLLTGTCDATTTVDGDLSVKIKITGTCDAQSTADGDLTNKVLLAGTCDAQSVVSGDIEVEKLLTGTCDAQSTADGDLTNFVPLTGTCDATTTVDGDIEVKIKLTGTCDATTTVDGDIEVEKLLTGTCDAQSSVSGDIEVEKLLTGTCDATTTIDGDIEVEKLFTGTCDATTTVDGDLSVKIKITGTCDAQSTVDGDLTVMVSLTGTCDAQSTVDGDIEVEKLFTGTCDATTTVDGDLTNKVLLTGTCDATTTADGDLEVEKLLIGTCDAQSSVSGDIEVEKLLTGTCDAQSSVDGELTIGGIITVFLTGTCDAQSNVSGDISVKAFITGTCDATSGVDADLTTFSFLTGSIIAQSAATSPGLEVLKNLTGIVQAAGSVDGNILVLKQFTGTVLGASNVIGDLSGGTAIEEAEIILPEDWMWIKDMILEDGRDMTITVPGGPADPNEPWRGNIPGVPVAAKGIFVQHTANQISGDHVRRQEQKLLIAPLAEITVSEGTRIYDSIDDSEWYVKDFKKITEETDILLYILKIRQ